jgi:predicted phage-related endonuclease
VNAVANVVPLKVGLTDEQRKARENRWGGSDATIIVRGKPEDVDRLIKEKRGDIPPQDFSDNLPAYMGHRTEEANLDWLQKKSGLVSTNRGESVRHPKIRFGQRGGMGCTLDGMTILENGERAIVQAKLVDQYGRLDEVVERYFPQVQHEIFVCDVNYGVLSVLFAHRRFEWVVIPRDDAFLKDLIEMERAAWECVETGEPWRDMPPPPDPELPEIIRRSKPVDMTGNNRWADAAHRYRELKPRAEEFKEVECLFKGRKANGKKGAIEALMPHDVREAYGYGVAVIRTADGKLSIREHKESADTPPPSAPITDEIPHFDNFFDLEKMET